MARLWKRLTEQMDVGLAATMGALKTASEKAAETTHHAQQKYRKGTLEAKILRQFGELGAKVYDKVVDQGVENPLEDPEIKALIEEIKPMEKELANLEAALEKEDEKEAAPEPEDPEKTEPEEPA